jgi:hypothetical protein
MSSVAAVADDPQQQLDWEARWRPRAGMAAVTAGVLTLAGFLWTAAAFSDLPRASGLTSFIQAVRPGPIGDQPSLRTPEFEFYRDHAFSFVGSSVVRGIAYLAFAYAITFLAVAARARRPEMPRAVVYVALVGAVLFGVAGVLGGFGWISAVDSYLDGPRTVDTAADVSSDSVVITASLIAQLAQLAIAAGLLLVALNAMRVGLLTRFLGILGMITGAFAVLEQFVFAFLLAFWMIALGFLFLGLSRRGVPPAWQTGQAEPWPPRQGGAARGRDRAQVPAPEPDPEPDPEPAPAPAGRPHASSKKRKRKRRG